MDLHTSDNISICTGGGALDLAVELAAPGARTVCMVEREAFAIDRLVQAMEAGVLAPAPVWADVLTFRGREWRGLVDGLFGGIPCQPHSEAGEQLAEEDERDLWGPARRIIVQARPWWILIENVGGMRWSGGLHRIWRDLRRLRFEVEAGLFTASEVGASQERERLFILAVASPDRLGPPIDLCDRGDAREEREASARGRGEMADADRAREPQQGGGISEGRGRPGHEGAPLGHAARLDGGTGLREAGPQLDGPLAGNTGGALEHAAGERRGEGRPEPSLRRRWRNSSPSPSGDVGGADRGLGDGGPDQPGGGSIGRTAPGRPSPASLFPPDPDDIDGWRRYLTLRPDLEPTICKRADGLADRIDRLRMLGNGVVPLEGAYALRSLATSLAYRGSEGAARLVRMMGG